MADNLEVGVRVSANTQDAQQRIQQLRQVIRDARAEITAAQQQIAGSNQQGAASLTQFATAAGIAGTASQLAVQFITNLASSLIDLVKAGARATYQIGTEYQAALNEFQAATRASADVMAQASDRAKSLGNDLSLPATSAAGAARALTELAKGGLTAKEAMDAALGTLQLAAAAGVSEARAAEIQAAALNSFALAGTEAKRVADLLAAAAGAGAGEIGDYAEAMKQAAAVSASAKVPIQDLVTEISLLAKNGLLGSDAGTSLKTVILRLVAPTDDARRIFRQLGIEVTDANGRFIGLRETLVQFERALAGLNDAEKARVLSKIFGDDAIRAVQILLREGATGFDEVSKALDRTGAAADLAAARTKGLGGAVLGLQSQAEGVGIAIYEAFAGSFEDIVRAASQYLGDIVKYFEDNKGEAKELQQTITEIGQYLRDFFEVSIKIFELDNPKAVAAEIKLLLTQLQAIIQIIGDIVIAIELVVKALRPVADPIGFFYTQLQKSNDELRKMGILVDEINQKSIAPPSPANTGTRGNFGLPENGPSPVSQEQRQQNADAFAERRTAQLKDEEETRQLLRKRALEVQRQIEEDERDMAANTAKIKLDLEGKLAEQRKVLAGIRLQQAQLEAQAEINEAKRLADQFAISREEANRRIIVAEGKRRDATIKAAEEEFAATKTLGLDPTEVQTRLAQRNAKIEAAQREFAEKQKAIEAEEFRDREARRRASVEREEQIQRTADEIRLTKIREAARTRLVTEEQAENLSFQVQQGAFARRRQILQDDLMYRASSAAERERIQGELKQLDKEVEQATQEHGFNIEQARQTDLARERAYRNQLLGLRQQAAEIYLEIQRQQLAQSITLFSERQDRIIQQANLDVEAENQRHNRELDSLKNQLEEMLANEQNEAKKLELVKLYNELFEAEEARHQEALNQIRTATVDSIDALDPTSPVSLFGPEFAQVLETTGSLYDALANTVVTALNSMSQAHGNLGSIARSAFEGMVGAIGQTVKSYVLLGQTGTAVFRRIVAETLATIAQQSAVKAIYELAEGFAMLFINPPAAAAHFKAAALYGIVAVTAGVAGRAVAGNLFQAGAGTAGGGGGTGTGGGGQNGTDQRQPTIINQERNVIRVEVVARSEPGTIIRTVVQDYKNNGQIRETIGGNG